MRLLSRKNPSFFHSSGLDYALTPASRCFEAIFEGSRNNTTHDGQHIVRSNLGLKYEVLVQEIGLGGNIAVIPDFVAEAKQDKSNVALPFPP